MLRDFTRAREEGKAGGSMQPFRRWTSLGLVLIASLYVYEAWHFVRTGRTDSRAEVPLADQAGCSRSTADPNWLVCPVKGYNTAVFQCMLSYCVYRDPSSLPLSLAQRVQTERQHAEMNGKPSQ